MATLYFNAAIDNDWSTLGNWWLDETLTTPATSLPTSADSVIALATISSNSGIAPTIVNFTLADTNFSNNQLDIAITVTGIATFNNGGIIWTNGSVVGNCVFNNSSSNSSVITGDCTFNDFSYQGGAGYITGNCIFNNNSTVSGTIVGNCTFNDSSYNYAGSITGDCTFNDYSYHNGALITGDCTFNDNSYYTADIDGNATFTASAFSGNPITATITGSITFSSATPVSFTISGSDVWSVDSSAWSFVTSGQNWIFNNYSSIDNTTINGPCAFNNNSFINAMGIVTGDCTFNNNGINVGTITGNCTLNDTSYNNGIITGNCTFNLNAYNQGGITGDCTFNDSSYNVGNIEDGISTINFNDNAYNNGTISVGVVNFNDNSFNQFSIYNSNTNFNDNSYNSTNGHLNNGDHYFNDSSYNIGLIDGSFAAYWNGLSGTNANGTFSQGSQVLFFNANYSDNWADLGDGTFYNWWLDEACTLPAASIPDANNSVNLLSSPGAYGNSITIVNLFVNNVNGNSESITVTGTATFNDGENGNVLTGNCIFNNDSGNNSDITGNCTLNNNSYNSGTITGDCIFNDGARNYDNQSMVGGTINGNVTFNSEYNDNTYGTINGNLTSTVSIFNYGVVGYIHGDGGVTGTTTFSSETPVVFNCNINFDDPRSGGWIFSTPGQKWVFAGNFSPSIPYYITVNGDAEFYDASYNDGTVSGDATFNDSSYCGSPGIVLGDVVCNDTSSYRSNITGDYPSYDHPLSITCYDSSYTKMGCCNPSDTTCNYYDTSYNVGYIGTAIFHDNSYNGRDPEYYGGYLTVTATFNDNSINYGFLGGYNIPFNTYPTIVFNDNSINNGPTNSPNYPASVTFNHNSYNNSQYSNIYDYIVASTVIFNDNSYSISPVLAIDLSINGPKPIIIGSFNNDTVVGPYYGNARIQIPPFSRAGLGVNGSNILGVI